MYIDWCFLDYFTLVLSLLTNFSLWKFVAISLPVNNTDSFLSLIYLYFIGQNSVWSIHIMLSYRSVAPIYQNKQRSARYDLMWRTMPSMQLSESRRSTPNYILCEFFTKIYYGVFILQFYNTSCYYHYHEVLLLSIIYTG